MRWSLAFAAALSSLIVAPRARADGPAPDASSAGATARDVRQEAPTLAYAYTAHGAPAGSLGAQAYGLGLAGRGDGRGAMVGGGVTAWGSPIDRLTLVGDASRDAFGQFAPSAAAIVRLLGRPGDGFSLGLLGKFKVDGFGVGPNDEIESEIESGLLLSYAKSGWHADLNAITGFGTADDGEIDTEGRLRLGRDLGDLARVGLDGQMRYRVRGDNPLVGGRTWDFAGGPQVMLARGPFFAALTSGPATMGVYRGVGWTGIVTLGGSAF